MRALVVLICAIIPTLAQGQGKLSDYERADRLPQLTANKVFVTQVQPRWVGNGNAFWYRNDRANGVREFVYVDPLQNQREPAFDHAKVAAALGKEIRADRLPIETLIPSADGQSLHFRAVEKTWKYDRTLGTISESPLPAAQKTAEPTKPRPERASPRNISSDDRWEVRAKMGNLVIRDRKSGEEFPLTKDAKEGDGYTGEVWWSPDSARFVAMRTKAAPPRQIHLIESSPRDQVQPRLHTFAYPKPGDPLPISKPHLFDISKRAEIPVADDLFPNPWSINQLRWNADSSGFSFVYNQRGHQIVRLIGVDAASGKSRSLINEECKTFFDYNSKLFLHRLNNGEEAVWMSERDGWNHLYLHDLKSGSVKNAITKGEWVVRRVERVDEQARQVWFWAGAIRPEQDPYHLHYCRANLDGTGLVVLTEGDGTHSIQPSPDGKYFIDTYSRVDLAPVMELRRAEDGKLIRPLEKADASALLATGWKWPERFVAKGRDGKTDIHGMIFRPTNFDPAKKYPIIEEIYAGPHDSHVPKSFRPLFYNSQIIAELGFIVVRMDGMGTSNRSKAFHDVCWKNLGDAGFPDRIRWIQAAAAKYPYLDLKRVGIFGGSAGGQNALRAMLAHGDFYHVAVADCGCHDNRMDKVWWNELWMSYPIGAHYQESSNVDHAHRLKGKLLLVVGEMDRNVDPASTLQVVNALVKADKDFELLLLPGAGHGAAETKYGQRRRKDFFVRHLLGIEPRQP